MRRLALAAALLPIGVSSVSAAPDLPRPVCAQSQVLQLVRERLRQAGQPGVLEIGSIGQAPNGRDLVNCAVRVHTLEYNTPRLGPAPTDVVSIYRYTLELRRNAVFLLPQR
jgi:hypothetical protein